MAFNSNPQAVKFCNERLRPACDAFVVAVRTLREMRAEYVAQGIGPLVAADTPTANLTIADGSAVDGRAPLLGFDVDNASQQAAAFLAWVDGAGASAVTALTKPAVNTDPKF
jgi:hypothetical protein